MVFRVSQGTPVQGDLPVLMAATEHRVKPAFLEQLDHLDHLATLVFQASQAAKESQLLGHQAQKERKVNEDTQDQ